MHILFGSFGSISLFFGVVKSFLKKSNFSHNEKRAILYLNTAFFILKAI